MAIDTRVRTVFVQALALDATVDLDAIRYRGHANWDSLGHMALVVALETEFDVEIEPDQLIGIDSLDAAVKVLRDLGVDG